MRWGGKGREMGGRREGERRRKKEGKGEEEGGKRGEGGQFYISLPVNTIYTALYCHLYIIY